MKRLAVLLVLLLLVPSLASAFVWSSAAERTLEQMLDTSGKVSILTVNGRAAPALSPTGQGRIYFDSSANVFKISVNGGAYATLTPGSSTVTGGTCTNQAVTAIDTSGVPTCTTLTQAYLTLTGITSFALRDTSAAFNVPLVATSSAALTADRILTLNMGNVAHTLAFGTTANTITFPNVASGTVAMLNAANVFSATNTFAAVLISSSSYIAPVTDGNTLNLKTWFSTAAIAGLTIDNAVSATGTSGAQRHIGVTGTFAPTSGTATYTSLQLTPTINQTGGASGITRGVYINPTLTAAADFRAFEVALGKVVVVPLASATGARYLCVDTTGLIVSQAAACVGT